MWRLRRTWGVGRGQQASGERAGISLPACLRAGCMQHLASPTLWLSCLDKCWCRALQGPSPHPPLPPSQRTFGRSSLGSFFLARSCTVCPFNVSSTASTTRSICRWGRHTEGEAVSQVDTACGSGGRDAGGVSGKAVQVGGVRSDSVSPPSPTLLHDHTCVTPSSDRPRSSAALRSPCSARAQDGREAVQACRRQRRALQQAAHCSHAHPCSSPRLCLPVAHLRHAACDKQRLARLAATPQQVVHG